MISFLYWYFLVSYLLGILLFVYEVRGALERGEGHLLVFGLFMLFLAPLTTWHGVLHYAQRWYCKFTNRPLKFWI
jgi:hypothetical protein